MSQQDRTRIRLMRQIQPDPIVREYRKAVRLIDQRQLQEGINALLALRERAETQTGLFIEEKLAEVYLDHGHVHPATEPFEKADQTDEPQEYLYYSYLALIYGWRKQFEDARRIYEKRMRLVEQHEEKLIETRIDIAGTYRREGDVGRACEELEQIWAENPDYGYAGLELALNYLRLGQDDDAQRVYEQLAALEKDDLREQPLLALRRSSEALQLAEAAIERYEKDGFPRYFAALAHLQLGDVANARRCLVEALYREPAIWDDEEELFCRFALTPEEFETLAEIWPS
jgi:tetratricopeptide (TPR) repeat protein